MYLLGAAAVVVVLLAWRVPEPAPSNANPAQRVAPVSCAKLEAPAPSYGARTMSNTTATDASNTCLN